MGFFSASAPKVKEYKQKEWQNLGIDFLKELLEGEAPVQGVAPLSPMEQLAQGQLQQFVSGESFRDPFTSPYYQGLRSESMAEESRAVDALRRRSQLAGALYGSPSYEAEGRTRGQFANQRMSLLGQLLEQESARDNPLTRAQAGMQLGQMPRLLEQAQLDAILQQAMFPYQTQAPIAQALMEHQPTLYGVPAQPSGLSQALGYAGGLTGILAGLGYAGGPFGFNWWGGGGSPGGGGGQNPYSVWRSDSAGNYYSLR